jgi:hypothetical protein
MPPAGYTQIPRNALYVRNSDGSGPYYLSAVGVMTAFSSAAGGDSPSTDFSNANNSQYIALLFQDL